MKKILSILLFSILIFGLIACKKPQTNTPRTTKYSTNNGVRVSIDEFIVELNEIDDISGDFLVLAPQNVREEYDLKPSMHVNFGSQSIKETDAIITERFYVCNEEKYGKQITDWGQYGGVAYNFRISITIDTTYSFEVLDLKFDYISVQRKGVNGSQYKLDVYNGEDCFASLEWLGYGFKDEQSEKDCIEGYLSEYLMPHSQFAEWYATKYEPSNLLVESGEKPIGARAYYYDNLWLNIGDSYYNSFVELAKIYLDDEITLLLPLSDDNDNCYPLNDYVIYSYDGYYDFKYPGSQEFIDPYILERMKIFDEELCPSTDVNVSWLLYLKIVLVPYKVDLEKGITFEWIDDYTANLYNDDVCFATIDYAVDKIVERDTAFLKTYVENTLKNSLHVVNPQA